MDDGIHQEQEDATSPTSIRLAKGGPLLVQGSFSIELADGSSAHYEKAALCRCGLSETRPFCDGSHRDSDFDD